MQKALMYALLEPYEVMQNLQSDNRLTELMLMYEELKTAPFGDVWAENLTCENVPADYVQEILEYEEKVLVNRR